MTAKRDKHIIGDFEGLIVNFCFMETWQIDRFGSKVEVRNLRRSVRLTQLL